VYRLQVASLPDHEFNLPVTFARYSVLRCAWSFAADLPSPFWRIVLALRQSAKLASDPSQELSPTTIGTWMSGMNDGVFEQPGVIRHVRTPVKRRWLRWYVTGDSAAIRLQSANSLILIREQLPKSAWDQCGFTLDSLLSVAEACDPYHTQDRRHAQDGLFSAWRFPPPSLASGLSEPRMQTEIVLPPVTDLGSRLSFHSSGRFADLRHRRR
jgi:hypothetical protein